MVLKLRVKGEQIKEYHNLLTVYSTENEATKEKILMIVTNSGSEEIAMTDIKGFTLVKCGRGENNE